MRNITDLKGSYLLRWVVGLLLLIAFVSNNKGAHADTITKVANADAYVDGSQPNTSYGSETAVAVGRFFSGEHLVGFLKFDLSSIPDDAIIQSAYLELTSVTLSEDFILDMYLVYENWSESTITYYNRPTVWGTPKKSFSLTSGSFVYRFNVLSLVEYWIYYGRTNYGLALYDATATTGEYFMFYSRECPISSNRPKLEVTYKTLSYISISGSAQVNENQSAQYTCTAYYSDGSTSNVTGLATWSENSPYATINSNGYLSTNYVTSDTTFTITAAYNGKTDTHNVTIKNTGPEVTSVVISGPIQVNESSGAQYTLTAYYNDGTNSNVTYSGATWSEDSAYATISNTGYLTTSAVSSDKSCRITAGFSGHTDTHDITIKDTPVPPPPDPPQNVDASDGTYDDLVLVTWSASTGATDYEIWRATSATGDRALIGTTASLSYEDKSANAGTTYYYWIVAKGSVGDSSPSNYDTGYRSANAPGIPTNISATKGEYFNKIRIYHTRGSDSHSTMIYRNTINDKDTAVLIEGASIWEYYDDEDVEAGITYYYWLRGAGYYGISDYSSPVIGWVASEGAPDLFVEAVTVSPVNPDEGDTVTLTVTIKNQGSGDLGSGDAYNFYVGFWFNTPTPPSINDLSDYETKVQQLFAGQSTTVSFILNNVVKGDMKSWFYVDNYNTCIEGNETNNLGPQAGYTWTVKGGVPPEEKEEKKGGGGCFITSIFD